MEELEDSTKFLKEKGLIKQGHESFIITGEFGEINLAVLLEQYYDTMYSQRYNGEYGNPNY